MIFLLWKVRPIKGNEKAADTGQAMAKPPGADTKARNPGAAEERA